MVRRTTIQPGYSFVVQRSAHNLAVVSVVKKRYRNAPNRRITNIPASTLREY